jgi:hypothetical protein
LEGHTYPDQPNGELIRIRSFAEPTFPPFRAFTLTEGMPQWVFEAVADAGFDWVRIHVKWGDRTGKAAPYGIKPSFMVVVNETVFAHPPHYPHQIYTKSTANLRMIPMILD